jgi:tRNA-Thr(GGU) m(6)t(6)A37 methyltransferase TsaA
MMMRIELEPIGYVRSSRADMRDDFWGGIEATIELIDAYGAEALTGLGEFSHAEVIFHFDRVVPAKIVRGARHPRSNPDWPLVGIFAQRGKNRPNRLGATIVRIVAQHGRTLTVAGLDAVDGTPVVDIKPVLREFLPEGAVGQPAWASELMADYWRTRT